ncbi:MAG: DUF1467 family protein [Pseudomonadota bacterium]
MGVTGSIVSFLMIWWVCLFMVLPMRPKSVWQEPDAHAKGVDQGAPVNPAIWWRVKRTTMIAVPLWFIVFLVISSGLLDPSRA